MSRHHSSSGFTSRSWSVSYFSSSPVESLYAESNEPSLYIRREKLSLQNTTKLAANPRNPAHNCVFNPKYERFYNNTPSAIKPLGLRIQQLLQQANISIKNVQPFSLPSKEPWTQNPPKVILDLHKNKKSEVYSYIFKTEYLEIKSAYKHYISIYTDGSKQDEKVACAVISPNFTDSIGLPDNSSIFTAEAGVGRVVRWCWVNFQCRGVLQFGLQ